MKYLNGEYYVEVKDHRYRIHPTEIIILRKRNPPTSLRTQYQVQNETQIRRNQKVKENDKDQLVVKNHPKDKQSITQKSKFILPNCPSSKKNIWLEFDKGFYCKNCEYILYKQKHQIDKKVLLQARVFSTRLNYATKEIRKIWTNMVNTNYNSTEDMIIKLQQVNCKTKLIFYKNISNYYDNMNIRMDEDPFAKNAQSISKIYHEVLLLLNFFETKPQVKNININYYDFYYTVIKSRDEKEIVDDKNENEYISLNDAFIPNHYVGINDREK